MKEKGDKGKRERRPIPNPMVAVKVLQCLARHTIPLFRTPHSAAEASAGVAFEMHRADKTNLQPGRFECRNKSDENSEGGTHTLSVITSLAHAKRVQLNEPVGGVVGA
jgi:hypothetical protein